MISLSKLLCDYSSYGDELRYKRALPEAERRPIVVWNTTPRCNLSCMHCYYDAQWKESVDQLSCQEAKGLISDLASFGVPVLLFS